MIIERYVMDEAWDVHIGGTHLAREDAACLVYVIHLLNCTLSLRIISANGARCGSVGGKLRSL